MAVKIVLFINQQQRGWTETFYSPSNTPPALYLAGLNFLEIANMFKFRHKLTYLYAMRVSTVTTPRISYTQIFVQGGLILIQGQAAGLNPDVVTTDMVLKLTDSLGHVRRVAVRGLADDDVIRDPVNGIDRPSPALTAGVTAYVQAVRNLGWAIRSTIKPPVGGLAWQQVIGVQPNGPITFIQTQLPSGIVPGPDVRVQFRRVPKDDLPGFPTIAQPLTVTTVSPYTFTIPYRYRNVANTYIPANMQWTPLEYQYAGIASGVFERFSEHKTGRPFGVLRGRARVNVHAQ